MDGDGWHGAELAGRLPPPLRAGWPGWWAVSGARLGDYQLESLLGRGGMGEVYRAFDTRRNRTVALKLLSQHLGHDRDYQERFRRESHVAARLTEPHVIPIHDYGEIDGRLYIDMRLVNGSDLGKILNQTGPMPPDRAVTIISQVADALDAAHSDGLVHRDVKPANVLVTTGSDFVYLVDFGVAYAAGNTQLTATGSAIGTLDYMAPERFLNNTADSKVDIYSLACLLHECLTARRPFTGDSLPSLMRAHLNDAPPKPSQLRTGIPAALDEVVARGMAKDPHNRYPTAGALAKAARTALTASFTNAVPAPPVIPRRIPPNRPGPPAHVPAQGTPPPYRPGRPVPKRPTNGLAIASLVLGILWIFWIGSILALIFGYVARSQIRRRGEAGDGVAIAGIVLGWVGVCLLFLLILIGIAEGVTGP